MAKELFKIMKDTHSLGAWFALLTSILLVVAGFLVPPTGHIDGNVLIAVGELFAFATLFRLPTLIESVREGKTLTLRKGGLEVSVTDDPSDDVSRETYLQRPDK